MAVILAYLAVCYTIGFVILLQVHRRRSELLQQDARPRHQHHHPLEHHAEPVAH